MTRSIWVAKWLGLPTSDHEVSGLNPARGGIQLILPSSLYDLNNVKRNIKQLMSSVRWQLSFIECNACL